MKRIILSLAAAALALPALQAQEEGTQYLKLKKDGQTLYAVPVEQVREMTFPNTYDYWGTQGKSLWTALTHNNEKVFNIRYLCMRGAFFSSAKCSAATTSRTCFDRYRNKRWQYRK